MAAYTFCPHCNAIYSANTSTCQACGQEFSAPVAPQEESPPEPVSPTPLPSALPTGHLYIHQWQTASCPFVVPPHILPGTTQGYFLDEMTRQYRERLAGHIFFTNTLIMAFCPLIGLLFIAPVLAILLFVGILGGVLLTYKHKKALWQKVEEVGMEPGPWAAALEANTHRPLHIALMLFLGLVVSGGIGLFLMGYFGTVPGGGVPGEQRAGFPPIPANGAIPAVRIPAHGAGFMTPGEGRRRQQ